MTLDETAGRRQLGQLHGLGVTLAIDDFGSGYSSLAYVRDFPVRVVKIDGTFIAGLGQRDRDRTIVRGVIELGHNLGLTVIAEGIETEDQYRELAALGCDHAQGYLFGAPQPADDLFVTEDFHSPKVSCGRTSDLDHRAAAGG